MEHPNTPSSPIAELVARARAAQRIYETWSQAQVDTAVVAAGWAIIEPAHNRELAELAVKDTGVGNVEDKVRKNHRKTFGLLRDLHGARSVGVITEDPARGIVEIARPVGVVCAITPSTNPGATPANKIINALKGRNAVIVAPSPKGWSTAVRLIEFIHQQFDRIGAPRDLVQLLPAPVNKQSTAELMRLCDLVVAAGTSPAAQALLGRTVAVIGGPSSRPMSDGLMGVACTWISTSSGPGVGMGVDSRLICNVPSGWTRERSCNAVVEMVAVVVMHAFREERGRALRGTARPGATY